MSTLSGSNPNRNFPDWLQAYLQFTVESEAPDSFHFWTGASVIAGALRRRVWIDQRYFQWTPNLYVVFVAPPGIATKSTTVNVGMSLLRDVEGVHFGPNSLTWQGLTLALEEAKDHIPLGEDDEGLPLFQPMACLTIPISELGTFLKPQDTDLVDLLVDLWDGQKTVWRHKTKTVGESTIVNPWINIIGCVTPAWLRQNFPMYLIEGGLTSRIIFVYADRKRHYVPYPSEVIEGNEFRRMAKALTEDLRYISTFQGEYTILPDARAWGVEWYARHWGAHEGGAISERFSGYLSRKQTHIHKLAIIIAASKRDRLEIHKEDLLVAERIVSGLETDLETIFKTIGIQDVGRSSNEVLNAIINAGSGGILESDLIGRFRHQMDHRNFASVTETLVKAGLALRTLVSNGTGGVLPGYKATPTALQDTNSSPERQHHAKPY